MTPANDRPLSGRQLLIVEDEYLIASDLESALKREGASIVGMANSVARGLELLAEHRPDAAVLDLNLGGDVSAPLAAALAERDVPFVIVTGYGESYMTFPEFEHAHVAEKPVDYQQVVRALSDALARANGPEQRQPPG